MAVLNDAGYNGFKNESLDDLLVGSVANSAESRWVPLSSVKLPEQFMTRPEGSQYFHLIEGAESIAQSVETSLGYFPNKPIVNEQVYNMSSLKESL